MKKILSVLAAALLMAGCTSKTNKASEAVVTEEPQAEASVDTLNISNLKEMERNMQEALAFLKECGAYFIATAEGDQPHVRAFNSAEIINGRLYLMTGKKKDVYKQMAKNPKFELIALKPSKAEWIRISGVLVDDDDIEVQKEFLRRNPQFNSSYQPGDGNMAMLYFKNATVRFSSFSGEERRVKF